MGVATSQQKVWDEFYRQALEDSKEISREVIEQTWAGRVNNSLQEAKLVMRLQAERAEKSQKILKRIWLLYDEDHSGSMSKEELQIITVDSLYALADWLPRIYRGLFESSMKIVSKHVDHAQRREIAKLTTSMMPLLEKRALEWVEARIAEKGKLCDRLWEIMDEDGSGEVSESEFLENYSHASIEVMDPMAMLAEAERELYFNANLATELPAQQEETVASKFSAWLFQKPRRSAEHTFHDEELAEEEEMKRREQDAQKAVLQLNVDTAQNRGAANSNKKGGQSGREDDDSDSD